jgi:hypothetical protein
MREVEPEQFGRLGTSALEVAQVTWLFELVAGHPREVLMCLA